MSRCRDWRIFSVKGFQSSIFGTLVSIHISDASLDSLIEKSFKDGIEIVWAILCGLFGVLVYNRQL